MWKHTKETSFGGDFRLEPTKLGFDSEFSGEPSGADGGGQCGHGEGDEEEEEREHAGGNHCKERVGL